MKSTAQDQAYRELRKRLQGSVPQSWLARTEAETAELDHVKMFVPLVLASGVLEVHSERSWHSIVCELADTLGFLDDTAEWRDRIVKTITELLPETPERRTLLSQIEDLLDGSDLGHGHAGYLLGLAVGQQLGPDAFKTGGVR